MSQGKTTPAPVANSSAPSVGKGKEKEVNPFLDTSALGRRTPDEEIYSPGAAAQRRLAGLGRPGPSQGNMFGGGPGGGDMLSGLLGAMGGGRGMGGPGRGPGMGSPGSSDPFSGLPGMSSSRGRGGPGVGSGMGGMGGSGIPGLGMGGLGMGGMDGSGSGSGMGIGMGGLGIGGSGGSGGGGSMRRPVNPGSSSGRPGAGRMRGMGGLGGLDDMGGLGGGLDNLTESLLSNLSKLGPGAFKDGAVGDDAGGKSDHANGDSSAQGGDGDSSRSATPRIGTWSGTGLQNNLADGRGV